MRKFNINGSLTTEGDLNIKGKLNVAGQAVSVEQETLTVKDNFIAINGNGTTLETAGMAGIIAVTGKEQYVLKKGTYCLNTDFIVSSIDPQVSGNEPGDYYMTVNEEAVNNITSLIHKLYPICCGPNCEEFDGWSIYSDPYMVVFGVNYYTPEYPDYFTSEIVSIYHDPSMEEPFIYTDTYEFVFENQAISNEDLDLLLKILCKADGSLITIDDLRIGAGQAYAAPIYDVNEDALKIGLGSYIRDENGNIIGFTFGAGQGQHIATRDNAIIDGHIIKWNDKLSTFVDGGELPESLKPSDVDQAFFYDLYNAEV